MSSIIFGYRYYFDEDFRYIKMTPPPTGTGSGGATACSGITVSPAGSPNSGPTSTSLSLIISASLTLTAGELLVVSVVCSSNNTISVSWNGHSLSNWNTTLGGITAGVLIFYLPITSGNAGTGSLTVSGTTGVANNTVASALVVSGLSNGGTFDSLVDNAGSGSSTTPTVTSSTGTGANCEFVIGAMGALNAASGHYGSWNSPFTDDGQDSQVGSSGNYYILQVGYEIVTTSGTSVTASMTGSQLHWAILLLGFN